MAELWFPIKNILQYSKVPHMTILLRDICSSSIVYLHHQEATPRRKGLIRDETALSHILYAGRYISLLTIQRLISIPHV